MPTDVDPEWVDSTPVDSWDPWGDDDPPYTGEEGGLNRTLGQWLEGLVPPDAQVHFFNAGREFAAGIQSTIEYHSSARGVGPDGDDSSQPVRIEIE